MRNASILGWALAALVCFTGTTLAQSCRQSVGAARARTLVQQCINISPATHPPCHDSNPCDMIVDEIQKGCGMASPPLPAFCRQYPQQR